MAPTIFLGYGAANQSNFIKHDSKSLNTVITSDYKLYYKRKPVIASRRCLAAKQSHQYLE